MRSIALFSMMLAAGAARASEDLVDTDAVVELPGAAAGDRFGAAVAGAGDVDGDGFADVAVGAYGASIDDASNIGYVYLYAGAADGVSETAVALSGTDVGGRFGRALDGAGDMNGDGFADLIVGAPYSSGSAGSALVFLGSAEGLGASPTAIWSSINDNEYYGSAVSGAGDVDGDGFDDVVVGSYGARTGSGGAWIYAGSDQGLNGNFEVSLNGEIEDGQFGLAVAGAGDLNDDGYADVAIVGLTGDGNAGAVWLYVGTKDGLDSTALMELETDFSSCYTEDDVEYCDYLPAVSAAGDVDADGFDDLLVGAVADGTATLWFGATDGPAESFALEGTEGDGFGAAVAGAGDLDADGEADVLVGASGDDDATGAVFLFDGSAEALQSTPSLTLRGGALAGYFGGAVAGVGDLNADGFDDLVVGAEGVEANRGSAYVYLGAAGYAADKDEGCGCATGGRGATVWLAALSALALVRRRKLS